MEFTELAVYEVTAGFVTEWKPYNAEGLARWIRDPRSTSYIHENHLRQAQKTQSSITHSGSVSGGRESWLGIVTSFNQPLDRAALASTLTAWIDRHEVLRSHVHIEGGQLVRLTDIPGRISLKANSIGKFIHASHVYEELQGRFDRATAPLHWPSYLFATVETEQSFTLYFAADHSLVDGLSLIMAPHELSQLYRGALTGEPVDLAPVGSYVDFSAAERDHAALIQKNHPAVTLWKDFIANGNGTLPAFPLLRTTAANTTLGTAQQGISMWLLDNDEAHRLESRAKKYGGGFTATMLAAMALTCFSLGGGSNFRAVLPRHTRNSASWLGALGWFVSTSPFELEVHENISFSELISQASAALRQAKIAASVPYLRVAELLAHTDTAYHSDLIPTLAPSFVISYIDTRYVPGSESTKSMNARVLRSKNYSPRDVYFWINRTHDGVNIAARFPDDLDAEQAVIGYLDHLRTSLQKLSSTQSHSEVIHDSPSEIVTHE
ncbi:MAG: condensation domain-containing protein [Mycobacteriaceae bacterium]